MRAALAHGGYLGCTFRIKRPVATPGDTRTRWGVATFGTATLLELRILPMTPPAEPPGMPPGTPPGTPPLPRSGGASSSLIICTFCGILVGVRSCQLMTSLWIFTTLTAAAGGGAGGGGGGGATREVISCVL